MRLAKHPNHVVLVIPVYAKYALDMPFRFGDVNSSIVKNKTIQ